MTFVSPNHSRPLRVLVFCAAIVCCLHSIATAQDKQVGVTDEEKSARRIEAAVDIPTKLKAAAEFVKKYPKSTLRLRTAKYLAVWIASEHDPALRLTYADSYLTLLPLPEERALVGPARISALVGQDRGADAFKLALQVLEQLPNDAPMLALLANFGADKSQRGDASFALQSADYGVKAVALIEADKKPERMEATEWATFKTSTLPLLYRNLGVLAMGAERLDAAVSYLDKASKLNPTDPVAFAVMGLLANKKYLAYANEYSAATGAARADALKKAESQLDLVIETYAHAVALAQPQPEFKTLYDQFSLDLQSYYKYRKGSLDGLQQLIDKYKLK